VPAHVGGDGGVLLGVAALVGAVEGEVARGGELGLDPVQPGAARPFDVVDTPNDKLSGGAGP
jgi:hypothetical protein